MKKKEEAPSEKVNRVAELCVELEAEIYRLERELRKQRVELDMALLSARVERVRQARGRGVRYMAAGNKLALKVGRLESTKGMKGVVDFGELGRYSLPLSVLEPVE